MPQPSVPLSSAPIIRNKLTATIAAHLHAQLRLGSVSYRPPFTVHLYDAKIIADPDTGGGELFSASRIDLTLATLPIGRGPLVIERLSFTRPTLHIERGLDGRFAASGLVRPAYSGAAAAPAMKLSDALRLRHFSMSDGTIVYHDPAHTNFAFMEWKGVSSEMRLAPRSAALYDVHFNATEAQIAAANIDGTLDIDALLLQVTKLEASVQAPDPRTSQASSPLPPSLQNLLHKYAARGRLTFSVAGRLPLMHP